MNPWKIIGWIVLGCMVLGLGFCGLVAYRFSEATRVDAASPGTPPVRLLATVTSFDCDPNHGRPRADVTVRNLSPAYTPLTYAKVYVEFIDSSNRVVGAGSGFLSPTSLPVQSIGDTTIYAPRGVPAGTTCRLAGIQDRDGNPIQLAR